MTHEKYMQQGLQLAKRAESLHEVPVGAVLVYEDKVIAEVHNEPISKNDPTAHAEILALRKGAEVLGNYRLLDTTLYVTLEPCLMCVGAMVHARIKKLVFGAHDPKSGAVCSVHCGFDLPFLNHQIKWQGGILESECSKVLTHFFKHRR